MANCLNCNEEFEGSYCGSCGQKELQGKITLRLLLVDFVQTFFLFDSSLYRTLKGLLTNPGSLVRAYLMGKRKTYLPPFQFFLLFMTIYLIVLTYFGDDIFEFLKGGVQAEVSYSDRIQLVQGLIRKNLNVMYFILTPIIALFVYLFYERKGYNYAETLVFAVYTMGAGFFLSSIVALLSLINTEIFLFKGLVTFGFFPFAVASFTHSRKFAQIVKSFLTILISYLVFVIIISVLVSSCVFLFYR